MARQGEVGAPRLGHYVRVTDEDPHARVDYFGSFNMYGPSVMEYSQFEYDQHLTDPNWSPHETTYLFDLLREYDLRFIIAADRYEYKGPTGMGNVKRRSVEEIKERYYTICRRLIRTRPTSDPQVQQQQLAQYSFDKSGYSTHEFLTHQTARSSASSTRPSCSTSQPRRLPRRRRSTSKSSAWSRTRSATVQTATSSCARSSVSTVDWFPSARRTARACWVSIGWVWIFSSSI